MRSIIILLLILLPHLFSHSQTLRLSLGASYPFHLKGSTNEDPYVPVEYQNIVEIPSIASFFSNSLGPYLDLSFRFNIAQTSFDLGFGLSFETTSLKNYIKDSEYIIGNEFNNKIISPYLTFGKRITGNYIYLLLGISLNSISGKGFVPAGIFSDQQLEMDVGYKSTISLRLGSGVDFKITDYFLLNVGAIFDFRTIQRDNVKFYSDEGLLFEARPVGDITLLDNTFTLIATLAFNANLW